MPVVAVPELFLGLLSLAIAAVWIGHIFANTIHDARHVRDTISITGSARKPISSNLVQWSLSVSGVAATPVEAARKLMDWLATPEAMALFSKNFAVVAIPGVAKPLEFVPADYEKRLIKNDFAWEAKNRDKILAEWTKRYDAKSAPKK